MNGFTNIVDGFSQVAIDALVTQADEMYISGVTPPPGGVEITGLQSGTSEAVARNNSTVLNAAFAGSEMNLIIPENTGEAPVDTNGVTLTGYWVVWEKLQMSVADKVLTFVGGVMAHQDIPDYPDTGYVIYTLDIQTSGITIYNILVSQGGFDRTDSPGVYSCVRLGGGWNTGNVTFEGGLLSGGSSNAFQQGRNNTVFNDVTFRDCREHLMYATGTAGDGTNPDNTPPNDNDPEHYATGLHFNRCTFSNPGTSDTVLTQESNHVQLRSYKDVSLTDCTIEGIPNTTAGQYGILGTAITKLRVTNTTINGYRSAAAGAWNDHEGIGGTSSDWIFDNIETQGATNNEWLFRVTWEELGASFYNSTFHGPRALYGTCLYDNCIFDIAEDPLIATDLSIATYHNTTWDCADSTSNRVLDTSVSLGDTITGTTTRICREDEVVMNWDIIPGSCP